MVDLITGVNSLNIKTPTQLPGSEVGVTSVVIVDSALQSVDMVMGGNAAYKSNPSVLLTQENIALLNKKGLSVVPFAGLAFVIPFEKSTEEGMKAALEAYYASERARGAEILHEVDLNRPTRSEKAELVDALKAAAKQKLFAKTLGFLDEDVNVEVAEKVADKAVEAGISVDNLTKDYILQQCESGGIFAGIIAATEIDGEIGNSPADRT